MPKYNYWEAGGKATSFSALPTVYGEANSIIVPTGNYILKIKAMDKGTADFFYIADGNGNSFKTVNFTVKNQFESFEFELNNMNGFKIRNPRFAFGEIEVKDIQLIEKPLGRATINGIDGFQSGKWNIHVNAKIIDDETLELNATATFQATELWVDVEPNTVYTLLYNQQNGAYIYSHGWDKNQVKVQDVVFTTNGNANDGLVPKTFTTGSGTFKLKIVLLNSLASGRFTFKRPMLNLGTTPVPYEKKRGERMVPPVPVKNLFNKETVILDKYIMSFTTGSLVSTSTWNVSDKMPVMPGESYIISGRNGYMGSNPGTAFYTGADEYITGGQDLSYTAPPNAAYMRTTVHKDDMETFQMERGSAATPYEPYRVRTTRKATKVPGKNIFDGVWERGTYVDGVTGNLTISTTNMATKNFQPVEPGKTYTISNNKNELLRRVAVYDENRNVLNANLVVNGATPFHSFTIPAGGKFIRFHYLINVDDLEVQLEEGNTRTAFEPYKLGLRKVRNPKKNLIDFNRVGPSANSVVIEEDTAEYLVVKPAGNASGLVFKLGKLKPGATYTVQSMHEVLETVDDPMSFRIWNRTRMAYVTSTISGMGTSKSDGLAQRSGSFPAWESLVGPEDECELWITQSIASTADNPFRFKVYKKYLQVEEGSTPTAVEPFKSVGRPAPKGLEFKEKVGDYINCGSVDLRDSIIEAEFRCKFNQTLPNTHAVLALHTYSTGILINQIGTSLLVYVGHSAAAANYGNFFEAGKDVEVKVIFDKTNNTITVYKNGVLVSGLSYPQYVNYPGIIVQNLYIAGHPSSYSSPEVVMKYMKVKKNGEVLLEHDYTNPRSIVGTKVKANVGLDGTIVGSPYQLNRIARR